MKPEELIKLGTTLGLSFNKDTNYKDSLAKGTIVFDGSNGQRFLIESTWPKEKILTELGQSLILMGKRAKCMEIKNVLSINSD
jgi:hypothetical protein